MSLKEARDRRDDERKKIAASIDPGLERKNAKRQRGDRFEAVAREWFEKFSSAWAPNHASTVIGRLERDVFPWLGSRRIEEITSPELLTALRRVESRGAIETAHRIKQVCGQVFRYVIATGRAQRDPSADLKGALTPVVEKHHAALTTPTDVTRLMRAIDGYQGSFVVRCALKLSALTFQRPGEVRKATWAEIDFDHATWRIPSEKMKMRREHLVPLSRQALAVLTELKPLTGSGTYVFPGARNIARSMSQNAIGAALRYLDFDSDTMTAHGFRTMASTLLNEMGWPADAIERQLAHAERDEVRGAYNRAEYLAERRRMMQTWSDYLDGLKSGGTVVPLHASA